MRLPPRWSQGTLAGKSSHLRGILSGLSSHKHAASPSYIAGHAGRGCDGMRSRTGFTGSLTNDVVVHVEQDALILDHEVDLTLALSRPSLPKPRTPWFQKRLQNSPLLPYSPIFFRSCLCCHKSSRGAVRSSRFHFFSHQTTNDDGPSPSLHGLLFRSEQVLRTEGSCKTRSGLGPQPPPWFRVAFCLLRPLSLVKLKKWNIEIQNHFTKNGPGELISEIDINILFWSGRFDGSSKDGDACKKLGLPTESSWKVFTWTWSQNFAAPSRRVPPE